MNAIDSVTVQNGGDRRSDEFKSDNVILENNCGNERTYALRRLRKDRPDLHDQVINCKLSAHAAMVQAGFRRKVYTLSVNLVYIILINSLSEVGEKFLPIKSLSLNQVIFPCQVGNIPQ